MARLWGKDVIDFNKDSSSVTNTGQAIMAIDLAAFGAVDAFKARLDTLARDLRASRRMNHVDHISLPGDNSNAARRNNARDGIPIAPALLIELDKVAGDLSIPKLI